MPTPEIKMTSSRSETVRGELRLTGPQIVELARLAGLLSFDQAADACVVYLASTAPVVPAAADSAAITEEGPRELPVTAAAPVVVSFELVEAEELAPAIAEPVPLPAEIPQAVEREAEASV